MNARALVSLAALAALFVPACAAPESTASDGQEDLGEASSALTTVTSNRGALANPNCVPGASSVALSITGGPSAPWKTLSANGSFSLGPSANGVQIRYWVDNSPAYSQTDATAPNAAAGQWSWTRDSVSCVGHTMTVCAIPYVNGNACGNLTAPTSSGYRVCQTVPFRGCANAVGVIPDYNTACPPGADTIVRHMDDEDTRNNNAASGWIGKTVSGGNTDLHYCRVDGSNFKPLTCSATAARDYAVLKLGSTCPNGSVEFWKYIDNEDHNNANWLNISSGDFHPNGSGSNTELHFCLFRYGSSPSNTMGFFPSLGAAYGVYGTGALVNGGNASTWGWFRTDDEDHRNADHYYIAAGAPGDTYGHATALVSAGGNTTFNTAKVITSANQGSGAFCGKRELPDPVCGADTCTAPEFELKAEELTQTREDKVETTCREEDGCISKEPLVEEQPATPTRL